MRLRTMVCSVAILALGGLPVFAQDAPPEGGPGGHGHGGPMSNLTADKLKTDLKLTDAQIAKLQPLLEKVKALFEGMRKEMGEPGKGTRPDMSVMKAKMDEMQKKVADILAPAKDFLSADQYKQLLEKFQPPKGGPGGDHGGPEGDEGGGPGGF